MLTLGRIVAALLSGALLAQAHGLDPFWPLAWIAPIPVLIAAIGASRVGALAYGAIAGAGSGALMFAYLASLSGLVPVIIITIVKALIWGGAAFAVRGAARHIPAWAAVFVFPTLMAGVDTLIATTSPHGTAGSLAYSQMDFIPAIQVASLGGAPAITFLVCLFASLVVFLIAKRAVIAALTPALIVAATLVWGFLRASEYPPGHSDGQELFVATLAGDDLDSQAADWRPTWEAYVFEVDRAVREGPRLIVLPEKIVVFGDGEADEALAPLAAIAREHDATIVVGAVAHEGDQSFNRA